MRRTALGLVTISLVVAACGGVDTGSTSTTVTPPPTTTSEDATTTSIADQTTTTAPTVTTTAPTVTTTAPPTTRSTLAGEPIEFGPAEGDVLMVIGVRFDDVLNLRTGPGADQPIRGEIPPTFTELVAEGVTRRLPSSFWIEVDYERETGWVHLGYIGYEGDVTDETATVVDHLGERPVSPTMTALGRLVATVFASDEPKSDIVQVTPVTGGDLSEVTYDVVGLGDDAIRGVRLHIFAEKVQGGFSLRSVEVTLLCGRGVDDGACV